MVDADLIQAFYATLYEQEVSGEARYRLLRNTQATAMEATAEGLCATLRDNVAGTEQRQTYAAVICATGYQRAAVPAILDPLRPFLASETVDRH